MVREERVFLFVDHHSPSILCWLVSLARRKISCAVEILSPSDVQEDIEEKIDALLQAGVPLVWIINPRRRTVTVYRPGYEPELFNMHQELSGETHPPGLRIEVRRLFAD
jgi:Uma2 family endonuclease